ncbi:MAG: molybdopterin-dependent oxidoreductase [Deltaproteobacteria bacterium]|nr:molybdopterin-dependent oxidoreductase [Deltaproteobacteria bacterium]
MHDFTRRDFLKSSGAAALALSLAHLRLAPGAAAAQEAVLAEVPYRGWEDLYRRKWRWDKVGRTTHFVNCWYQAHCNWNVYLKDGIVWREEQVGDYPQTKEGLPDFNPRGCQKGACYSHRMYDASRLKWPLKRVGERGAGKWQRISWDQALGEIADIVVETIEKEGSDKVVWSLGPLLTLGTMGAGVCRLGVSMDNVLLDMNTEIGDGHRGAAEAFGKIVAERSADDYFHSDLILLWGCNPLYTQIPNAHFLTEARYHGSRIVAISPDYNASAIKADAWIPVRVGTDAALALAMVQTILAENLHDEAFLREQTDLGFLVRDDTHRYLRESDLEKGGSEETLYVYDEAADAIAAPPMSSLALGNVRPALRGSYEAKTLDGPVKVRPVFERLREQLDRDYTPEQAAKICGVAPETIRALARDVARAKAAANVTSSNWGKFYHGNLVERAMILLLAVCGHMGRKGAGYSAFPFLVNDGFDPFLFAKHAGRLGKLRLRAEMLGKVLALKMRGFSDEMVTYEIARDWYAKGIWTSGTLFWQVHGGLLELADESQKWDPYMKRSAKEHLAESLEKRWQYVYPPPGQPPRVVFEVGSNVLRRLRGYQQLFKHFFPNLRAFVTLDSRMTSSAMQSDYVLPVTAWYERTEHKWVTPLAPFIHGGEKIAPSYHESKSDWEISALLAKKIQERAAARGVKPYTSRLGEERRLDRLWETFSYGGTYSETDDDKVAGDLLRLSTNLEGVEWEAVKKKGWARFTGVGEGGTSIGNACEIKADDTVSPFTFHVDKKIPYPTLTRRIQFYLDHDLYLELGEALPTHKDPPKAGGDHPLILTGGHTRWSIHSSWRDDALMLRQQRGEPVMYMSVEDARARGVADGDTVEVRNDVDAFQIHAKLSPSVRPGQVVIYHAWENFQFRNQKGFQNLMPTPLNPVELAGGQFHLRPNFICMQPSVTDRDTRVEVVKVA